ncbi:glycoside hydrolase family 2 protein [Ramlibacter ginsenosidimutans]|uniref:beta-mannosidase n=2 Tax=Ramlibacter ginsenosidimutans TaxID=502333 RepID=A0A934WLM8_9BURK|nr:glycoside hydrolase family 2 protein [Ramlibacter ginsenosidimutans]
MQVTAWRVARTEPGAPAPGEGSSEWIASARAQTAAAALRDAGRWSLDGPALDFDASDWWFSARIARPEHLQAPLLVFDGLATLATVTLDGEPLFASRNMYRSHRVPLAGRWHDGPAELRIHCAALAPELALRRPRPRWRTPMLPNQQLRWLRTTLLGRTPGWSPPAPPVGPWRDVWLAEERDAPTSRLQATLHDRQGRVRLDVEAPRASCGDIESAELVVAREGREWRTAVAIARDGSWTAELVIDAPALWWPHTHGEPALYDVALAWQERSGRLRRVALGRTGFRRIEIDTGNDGFAVRVNGELVFCRGAGWTPLDPVSLRATPEALHAALTQTRDGGLNMLRLAGTTVYEEDAFYAACDEIGLLVWQDFMFASMDYPLQDEAFAADALAEAREQLRRLGSHPCLAVLCGNSEVEQQAAMWGAPRELWQPRFFHVDLRELCAAQAPQVPYWPSSAHGGAFPHIASCGTTSYYGVGAYERPLEDARHSGLRFATECLAFAGVPSPDTLSRLPGGLATRAHHPAWKQRSPRDLGAGWDFDDVRDHYVQRLFAVDPARLRHSDHERYLALGRLAVAQAMEAAFGEWRRPGSACGGALLLFLRDLWAGAGWGVLDDQGLPKSGWHALRRAWQPLALSFTDEGGNGVAVHVVNDGASPVRARLQIQAWRDPAVRIAQGEQEVEVPARGGLTLSCVDVLGQFIDLNHAYRFGPAPCDALFGTLCTPDGRSLAEAVSFPAGLAALLARPRPEIGLTGQVLRVGGDVARVVVSARDIAVDVQVEVPGWTAQDSHFHLPPGGQRELDLHRHRPGAPLAGRVLATNALGDAMLEGAR